MKWKPRNCEFNLLSFKYPHKRHGASLKKLQKVVFIKH